MRHKRVKIVLDPNSEYHRILVNNLGREGAIKALERCNLAYSMDMESYAAINKWRKRQFSPAIAR